MKIRTFFIIIISIVIIISNTSTKCADNENSIFTKMSFKEQLLAPKIGIEPFDYYISYANNKLYLIEKPISSIKSDTPIKLYECAPDTNIIYDLIIPDNDWIINFTTYENYIFILGQYNIYIYKIMQTGIVEYKEKIYIDKYGSFSNIYLYDNHIVLSNSCIVCTNPGYSFLIYDMGTKEFKHKQLDNPIGYPLTYYQPKRNINYYKGKFLITDITNYKITIFDSSFSNTEIIARNSEDWDNGANNEFNQILSGIITPKELKSNLEYLNVNFMNYFQLLNADFVNDKTILVCWRYNIKDTNNVFSKTLFHYDVWEKEKDGKWVIIVKELKDNQYKPEDKFDINKYLKLYNQYFLFDGKIIIPSLLPPLSLLKSNINMSGIQKEMDTYYMDNDIHSTFFIYNFEY